MYSLLSMTVTIAMNGQLPDVQLTHFVSDPLPCNWDSSMMNRGLFGVFIFMFYSIF